MIKKELDISYVLVDWGTTSLRVWCVDANFRIVADHRSSLGMRNLSSAQFEPTLETILRDLNVSRNIPVLICGMAGAKQGWLDAGYIDVPTRLDCLVDHVCIVATESGRDVRIVPGLAQRDNAQPDVMRGEETILLGAALVDAAGQTFCIPGTHSKWVHVEDGDIISFSTYMTGELFSLLSDHSTLSALISHDGLKFDRAGFLQGFNKGMQAPANLTHCLFCLRAEPLLDGGDDPVKLSSILSGMLVAAEFSSIQNEVTGSVCLIASGRHLEIYQLALNGTGVDYTVSDSEKLVLSGLSHMANQLWGN